MKIKITIGDWSQDGHNQYDESVFESNKTVEEIQDAYKASCKLTGIQFNHNEDYTGLKLGYRSPFLICTEYEDSKISAEALEILKKHNVTVFIDDDNGDDEDPEYYLDQDSFLQLLIDFIKISLPDWTLEEAAFKKSELRTIPAVNGWWNGNLNVQFGYGLFN